MLQAVVSRAAFRRVPPSGEPYFTVMSLHINNHYAERRAIEKHVLFAVRVVLCQEQVDMVAGDFNGAAWRKKNGHDQQRDRTIEEVFANTNIPIPHGSSPLRVQETFQENGPTYVDSSSRRTLTVSGRYVGTAHSKSIAMLSAVDPPTKVATTPTLGWSTVTVFATLPAPSMTADKARKEATLMTTFDHSLVQRMCHPYDSTWRPLPPRCSKNEC